MVKKKRNRKHCEALCGIDIFENIDHDLHRHVFSTIICLAIPIKLYEVAEHGYCNYDKPHCHKASLLPS